MTADDTETRMLRLMDALDDVIRGHGFDYEDKFEGVDDQGWHKHVFHFNPNPEE